MYQHFLYKYPNGLTLLMVPSKDSLSFQFTVVVNTGSDFENKQNNGISHFLEHLCFKGTKKRKNNFEIARELDSIGANYNAFTSNELTGYFTRVASDYIEKAIDIVADIYLNSRFPEEEIEKERGVILEEIKMYHDDPKDYVRELWNKLLYGDQPAGWPITGSVQNVKKIKREDIISYREKQYRSKSTLIIASGKLKPKQVIDLVQKYFQVINKGKGSNKPIFKKIKTPSVLLEYRPIQQTNFILGTYGVNMFDKRRYALNVFNVIFGGGMSGKLYQLVREKLGAAYYVYSSVESYSDRGEYTISAGIDSDKIFVIKEILKEMMKLVNNGVSQEDLKKAKDYLKGKLSLSLEDVHDLANNYGYQLLLKKEIETPQEYLRKINQITLTDIKKVVQGIFNTQEFKLALIGPFKKKEPFYRLLKI